jgi:hypothetical protein
MPNWCQNQLTVRDATPELRAYLEHNGFSFARMVPLPPLADPGDDSAAVAQQVAAWGTKWDLDEDEGQMVADALLSDGVAFFDTAWSPPIEALEALSRSHPQDTFALCYCEPGMMFAGNATFQEGHCCDRPVSSPSSVNRIARTVFGI